MRLRNVADVRNQLRNLVARQVACARLRIAAHEMHQEQPRAFPLVVVRSVRGDLGRAGGTHPRGERGGRTIAVAQW